MDGAPASIARVQAAVNNMMTDIGRSHLIPSQKQAFLCCAKCCDTNSSEPQGLQDCVERCSATSLQQQKVIQSVMADFQERFQRCAMRCQDQAREAAGFEPSQTDQMRAKDTFSFCLDGCGSEYEAKMPKLKADIVQQLKRL